MKLVREVASFMHFYPAYRLRDVMEEYAITFYALLNEGYRQQHQEYLMQANIAMLSTANAKEREQFLKQLQWASKDPDDILRPSDDYSGLADVKKMLGK